MFLPFSVSIYLSMYLYLWLKFLMCNNALIYLSFNYSLYLSFYVFLSTSLFIYTTTSLTDSCVIFCFFSSIYLFIYLLMDVYLYLNYSLWFFYLSMYLFMTQDLQLMHMLFNVISATQLSGRIISDSGITLKPQIKVFSITG